MLNYYKWNIVPLIITCHITKFACMKISEELSLKLFSLFLFIIVTLIIILSYDLINEPL